MRLTSLRAATIARPVRSALIVFLTACVSMTAACQSGDVPGQARAQMASDFFSSNVDHSVKPGDDFFQFANGAWFKRNPIPGPESAWGVGQVLQEEVYANLRRVSEKAVGTGAARGTDNQQIGDFWATGMDPAKAEQAGLTPFRPYLTNIDQISSVQQILDVAFALQEIGVDALFDISVEQDEKNSDEMAVHLLQGGLGLPDRDFYIEKEAEQKRAAYVPHMARMLAIVGRTGALDTAAQKVMVLETALAQASFNRSDRQKPELNYNKMSPAELAKGYTPSIDWSARLARMHLDAPTVIVGQPKFFAAVEKTLTTTSSDVLKDYLRLRLVSSYAPYLNQAVVDEDFSFTGKVLNGQKEQRLRWKRVLDAEEKAMGMVLGRLFVREYFPESSKRRYDNLVEAIRTSFGEHIEQLDWMAPDTAARALKKLKVVGKKVGYPDKWKDYSALNVGRDSYVENMMSAARWRFNDETGKLGKPVDRAEWHMTPQSWNAYYAWSNNEIVLPAEIFAVPGIKDSDVDDAIVYGYAGASTIGHELTHGFDSQGRKYDDKGNLADWWAPADDKKFNERADVVVRQFSAFEPLPGKRIRGDATIGENIADLGGLMIALDAFKKTEQYKKGMPIGGFTPLQRFFMGYAFGWMIQVRDARLERYLLDDFHTPPKWRVLGPLPNIPEFYEAFDVKPGQAMYRAPESRARIW
jgi:putative endopeptidase